MENNATSNSEQVQENEIKQNASSTTESTVFYVDDDEAMCESVRFLIESVNLNIETFTSAKKFLDNYNPIRPGCLLLDVRMPEMSGLELQEQLRKKNVEIPIIFITGHGDVPMATRAMKAGAIEFLTKPFNDQTLLDSIQHAIETDAECRKTAAERDVIAGRVGRLTPREYEVMKCVVKGNLNKVTAYELGISSKTVELHRAKIMQKMEAKSLAHLVSMMFIHEGHSILVSDNTEKNTQSTDNIGLSSEGELQVAIG